VFRSRAKESRLIGKETEPICRIWPFSMPPDAYRTTDRGVQSMRSSAAAGRDRHRRGRGDVRRGLEMSRAALSTPARSPESWTNLRLSGFNALEKSVTFEQVGSPAVCRMLDDVLGEGNWQRPARWLAAGRISGVARSIGGSARQLASRLTRAKFARRIGPGSGLHLPRTLTARWRWYPNARRISSTRRGNRA
jgi:hypothetical protein